MSSLKVVKKRNMETKELIKYELPNWVEFISIGWMQDIIAYYYGKKVNRKWHRYLKRQAREKYLEDLLTQKP